MTEDRDKPAKPTKRKAAKALPPDLSPTLILKYVAKRRRVAVSVAKIAKRFAIDAGDLQAFGNLKAMIAGLASSCDLCEWVGPSGRDLVSLTPGSACLFGLRLNKSSNRWLRADEPDEPPVKNRSRRAVDGSRVICETDMSEEPPGALANMPDRRTEAMDDPDFGLALILADEKRLGLVRPTLPLVGVQPWTAEDWERDHDEHGKPFPGGGMGSIPKLGKPVCPVCNGRELRPMVGLVAVRAGKNRAARPPAVVDGGEYCCRCAAHWLDGRWPKVRRLGSGNAAKGKVAQ